MNVTHKKTLQSWVALMFAMIMVFTIPMTVQASVPGTSTLETVDSNTVKEKIPYIHKHTGSPTSGGGCYTPVYHTHTGSTSSGGGCYTTPNYHQHTSSCYTNEYHQHTDNCYKGHEASCYHTHTSLCKHTHTSSCYHEHDYSCMHDHVYACRTHGGNRYNFAVSEGYTNEYGGTKYNIRTSETTQASGCYASAWNGSNSWIQVSLSGLNQWMANGSTHYYPNDTTGANWPNRVSASRVNSGYGYKTNSDNFTLGTKVTVSVGAVAYYTPNTKVCDVIQLEVSNSKSLLGCWQYDNYRTCKITCGYTQGQFVCGKSDTTPTCGKNTTTNYCGKTSGTNGTLECGYSSGHIQGAPYGRTLVCGKTTSTIENTYLHCTKTPGVTVDSWSLGCGKTPSTIESYKLGCGKNEGDVEKYVYIHYHLDGGKLTKTSTLDSAQTSRTLPIPDKNKYSFVAWHLSSPTGTTVTTADALPASDIHVYVEWEECSGTVYFKDTATKQAIAEPKLAGKTTALKTILPDYKKDGYETSWWLDQTATDPLPDTLTMSADEDEMTIWAHLTPITYVVEIYDSINPDPIDTKTVKFDEWIQLPTIKTKNPGHQHIGWTKNDENVALELDNNRVKNLTTEKGAVVKLYALWNDVSSYTVALPAAINMNYDATREMFVGNYSVTADGDIPTNKFISVALKSEDITMTGEKTGKTEPAKVVQATTQWVNETWRDAVELGTAAPGQITSSVNPDDAFEEDFTSEVVFVFSLQKKQ